MQKSMQLKPLKLNVLFPFMHIIEALENEHFCAKEIALTLMPEIFIALSEDY